jgi:hypothetical protein
MPNAFPIIFKMEGESDDHNKMGSLNKVREIYTKLEQKMHEVSVDATVVKCNQVLVNNTFKVEQKFVDIDELTEEEQ